MGTNPIVRVFLFWLFSYRLEIDTLIVAHIHPPTLLCTDTATNFKKFAKMKSLYHETVNELQNNIYHIQYVNNFHNRLKGWVERFFENSLYFNTSMHP